MRGWDSSLVRTAPRKRIRFPVKRRVGPRVRAGFSTQPRSHEDGRFHLPVADAASLHRRRGGLLVCSRRAQRPTIPGRAGAPPPAPADALSLDTHGAPIGRPLSDLLPVLCSLFRCRPGRSDRPHPGQPDPAAPVVHLVPSGLFGARPSHPPISARSIGEAPCRRAGGLPRQAGHDPVNLLAGFLLLPGNTAVAVKYAVIVVLTIAVSLALYESLIRRFDLPRFLFGMKRAASARAGPASPSAAG
jgi:hypothetical protein